MYNKNWLSLGRDNPCSMHWTHHVAGLHVCVAKYCSSGCWHGEGPFL